MASKHPHRLLLQQKKTWRCTLPNCRYFIHIGLAHTLPGQVSICWECGGQFTLDERALQDDQPICDECRGEKSGEMTSAEREEIIDAQIVLGKMGLKRISQVSPEKLKMMIMLGQITERAVERFRKFEAEDEAENNEIEVIDTHDGD